MVAVEPEPPLEGAVMVCEEPGACPTPAALASPPLQPTSKPSPPTTSGPRNSSKLSIENDADGTETSETMSGMFSSSSISASTVTSGLLEPLILKEPLLSQLDKLYKVPMRHLNCSFDTITPQEDTETLRNVVRDQNSQNGTDVTMVFAIRYPA
mmetsp:Transcript_6357/g.13237  ORF Transcript_6357/g.13237 Transcript_6357/m.13237 type:complete len:154 (-) Transcript_6357:762-1223(-)